MRFTKEYPEVAATTGELLASGEPVLDLPRIPSARLDAAARAAFDAAYPVGYEIRDAMGTPHWTTREFAEHAIRCLPPRILGALVRPHPVYGRTIDHPFIAHTVREYAIDVSEHRDDEGRHRSSHKLGTALAMLPVLDACFTSGTAKKYWGWRAEQDYADALSVGLTSLTRHSPTLAQRIGDVEGADLGAQPAKVLARARAAVSAGILTYALARDRGLCREGSRTLAIIRRNLSRLDRVAAVAAERGSLDSDILTAALEASSAPLAAGAL